MSTTARGRFREDGPWTFCDRADMPGHGEGCTCAMRPLTEAEYAAALPGRAQAIADDLNQFYADVLPDGMRFEWTTTKDQPHEP